MNSTNKKPPQTRGILQPVNRPSELTPKNRPGVAQLKTGVSAQSSKQPVAPPVYRPQTKPKAVQTKVAGTRAKGHPVGPPVYAPQRVPVVLQRKKIDGPQTSPGQQTDKTINSLALTGSKINSEAKAFYRNLPAGLVQRTTKEIAQGSSRVKAGVPAPPTIRIVQLAKRIKMREKLAKQGDQIDTHQLEANWNAMRAAPPAGIEMEAPQADFWEFTVTAGGHEYSCHISFHGLFSLPHVTVITEDGKVNYWCQVSSGVAGVPVISDAPKKVLDKEKKGSKMISNLPQAIKAPIINFLGLLYANTC